MEITAKMVKDLRESTGAGMMDCKKALTEAEGDMERAVDILRTKGLAALAKKAGRATHEGVIAGNVSDSGLVGALVEVNCETDFVARNADFQAFVADLAAHVASAAPADMDEFMSQPMTGRDLTVERVLGEVVAKLGENMVIARFTRFEREAAGLQTVYIHGVGNIGVLVELAVDGEVVSADALTALGKDVAMQIAAAAPVAVRREDVPADVVEHEMAIYKAQAAESGKPEQIQEKIALGRMDKFYKEVALLEQAFVKDPDITVEQRVAAGGTDAGATITVTRFDRWVLGETNEEPKPASC